MGQEVNDELENLKNIYSKIQRRQGQNVAHGILFSLRSDRRNYKFMVTQTIGMMIDGYFGQDPLSHLYTITREEGESESSEQ